MCWCVCLVRLGWYLLYRLLTGMLKRNTEKDQKENETETLSPLFSETLLPLFSLVVVGYEEDWLMVVYNVGYIVRVWGRVHITSTPMIRLKIRTSTWSRQLLLKVRTWSNLIGAAKYGIELWWNKKCVEEGREGPLNT